MVSRALALPPHCPVSLWSLQQLKGKDEELLMSCFKKSSSRNQ